MTKQAENISASGAVRNGTAARASAVALVAGPFDASHAKAGNRENALSGALVTGVLVVYPVLATVAAIIIGLSLAAPTG